MKRFGNWLKKFFLPGPEAPLSVRLLPYAVLGLMSIIVLISGAYAWEYTNSPSFCGTSCHTMPPEYTAYLVSPHARVACVECHIGRDFIATQITRKAGDLKHVVYTITKDYEYPIRAGELRPARETCEKCHNPEKFSDDSLREERQYGNDLENTPQSTYLIMKTGGGSKRQGLGRGIHWHVENRVFYYPTDELEQEIPFVVVNYDDGRVEEFTDIESDFDRNSIQASDLKEMDCITCHNRITHLVPVPEESVDSAIFRKLIDPSIPEIRKAAVEALRASESVQTDEEAVQAIAAMETYYQENHAEYYAANSQKVAAAISAVQDIYRSSVYKEQKSDWNSHPNNLGHRDSPGCFRCHDGTHLNPEQEAIRLECNLCHSIPSVSEASDFVQEIEISRGPVPESHLSTNWIAMHNEAFDETCSNCHTTENPGAATNTSFCSNSACHGSAWEYAGFDAPALREVIQARLPEVTTGEAEATAQPTSATTAATSTPEPSGPPTFTQTILPIFKDRCAGCHGSNGIAGLNLTSYDSLMAGGTTGPAIIPGNPRESLLIKKQTAEQAHFGQLTSAELQLVSDWIAADAPE